VVLAGTLAELDARGGIVTVAAGRREAVVVRARDGGVFAVDRFCPHEGHVLDDADVAGETITCPWHGWAFDLRSGTCLTAGEDTRAYRVEIRGDEIYVDLDAEPTPAERGRLAEVLLSAVEAGDGERSMRHAVRLLAEGATMAELVGPLARYGATHGEELSPAAGALADVLELAAADPSAAPLLGATAAGALAELDGRRLPRLPAEPATAFMATPEELAAAIEDRDANRAEAVAAGLARSRGPDDAALAVARAAAARFRGPDVLPLVERAACLAPLAPAVVPAAARAAALAPPLDGAGRYRDRTAHPGDARELAADLGRSLLRFDAMHEEDARSDGSLLAVARALVFTHAAVWAGEPAALAHAAWLAEDARAWRGAAAEPGVTIPSLPAAVADAAGSAAGTTVLLAAARVALAWGERDVEAGVRRLLAGPRRERFVARTVEAERRGPAAG
jgi:nitrite reductase (NADH) small subunit